MEAKNVTKHNETKILEEFSRCPGCNMVFAHVETPEEIYLQAPGKRKLFPLNTRCPFCEQILEEITLKYLYRGIQSLKEKLYQVTLDRDQLEYEAKCLRTQVNQLSEANSLLKDQLDDARQMKFSEPVTCKCGCGKFVKQPKTGRKREFFSDACRQKYFRQSLRKRNKSL